MLITGVGSITPLGVGVGQLMDRWLEGECGIVDGEARCLDFDPSAFVSSRDARRMDRFTQLAVAAAGQAVEMAGWDGAPPGDPLRAGCIIGTAFGGVSTLERNVTEVAGGDVTTPSSTAVPMALTNAATGAVAARHGLMGPTFPISSACAAGADAIAIGMRLIQAGAADLMLVGAAEAPFSPFATAGLATMRALSISGVSRPFDMRRDGFVLGEGAAVIVLEAADHGAARGARPLGEVLGAAMTNDIHHMTMPAPDGRGIATAMAGAMADAGLRPQDVDYVNAHGTSTPANDRIETIGIKRALGERAWSVPVSSTKSAVGHQLGAAGAIDAVATLEALRRGIVPPTLGYEVPDAELDLDYVPAEPRRLGERSPQQRGSIPVAISNSAGFGGHNTALCLSAA